MLETPHVIVGAAIATHVVNPALALPLAFASHFVLEKVPHWNPHLNTEKKEFGKPTSQSTSIVLLDAALALASGIFIASRVLPDTSRAAIILIACFCAILPDFVEAPYYFLGHKSDFIEKKWIPFKKSLQVDTSIVPGLTTQAITVVAAFWWIFA